MSSASTSWNNLQSPSAAVVQLHADRTRLIVDHPSGGWWGAIGHKMGELTSLERGWDGYNAGPVTFESAYFALNMLRSLCTETEPEPQIVPGSNGDLQIEWHEEAVSIELHVIGPNHVQAWRRRNADGFEEATLLRSDFGPIVPWMSELKGPIVAAFAAAS